MKTPNRHPLSLAVLLAGAFAFAACGGDDNGTEPQPTTGSVQVTTTTTGAEPDDGYTYSVDGGAAQAIGPNASATVSSLDAGSHTVELADVAANCTVAGSNPRTVTVTAGATATAAFTIACTATTGSAEISVATTGDDIDADGYTVTVDGGSGQAVGVNGTVTFSGLTAGDHDFQLTGVANNCSVTGANPRTLTVPAGGTATSTFAVTCSALVGDIEVTTATTGDDVDADGYTVTVDGGSNTAIGVNDAQTITGVAVGDRSVELTGVAANCTVAGTNPRTVTVSEGATAAVAFDVACTRTSGDIEVSATTTGDDLDPDGYQVTLDGGSAQPLAINAGTVTFADLAPGDYAVELTDVAANCSVAGDNPRTITVTADAVAQTSYDVTCTRTTGDIEVNTSTTGQNLDGDGYTVSVDGGAGRAIGINGTETFLDLAPADYSVELTGLAGNCNVVGDNPRTVTVTADAVSTTTFDVACTAPLSGKIVFQTNRTGNFEIFSMNLDGSNPVNLTNNTAEDFEPAISPDGQKIAFWTRRDGNAEVYVMGVDGNGQTNVSNMAADDEKPVWSPDGGRIAFQRKTSSTEYDIWVMDADGSNARQVTTNPASDADPTWVSPTQIAFTSDRSGDSEIWIINDDGSAATNLTNVSVLGTCGNVGQGQCRDSRPDWSPDASLFTYDANHEGNAEIWVMDQDGSNQTQLTTDLENDFDPTWASNGTRIVWTSERDAAQEDIFIADYNSGTKSLSGITNLTNSNGGAGFSDGAADVRP